MEMSSFLSSSLLCRFQEVAGEGADSIESAPSAPPSSQPLPASCSGDEKEKLHISSSCTSGGASGSSESRAPLPGVKIVSRPDGKRQNEAAAFCVTHETKIALKAHSKIHFNSFISHRMATLFNEDAVCVGRKQLSDLCLGVGGWLVTLGGSAWALAPSCRGTCT